MVICLERGADLHMAQRMPLPLTVSCFSKIQIGFTFLVPAHPGSPGEKAVKRVCVCVCVCIHVYVQKDGIIHTTDTTEQCVTASVDVVLKKSHRRQAQERGELLGRDAERIAAVQLQMHVDM